VPDVAEEVQGVTFARDRLCSLVRQRVDHESRALADLRARPALADPGSLLDARRVEVSDLCDRGRRAFGHVLDRAHDEVRHQHARARALSPLATLERGYAVVQVPSGDVVTSVGAVTEGTVLSIRVVDGRITATTTGVHADTSEEGHG
jgi:exodeoxyribonuclease VII large subunit